MIVAATMIFTSSHALMAQQVVPLDAKDRALTGTPATVYSVGTENG